MDETTQQLCPWCSAKIEPGSATCPTCGASLAGGESQEIPGVTVVDAKAPFGPESLERPDDNPLDWYQAGRDVSEPPAGDDPFEPPSEAVRNEMRKMALEAEILNAGGTVMSATGDEAEPVGPPSEEALEAEAAGLLDETGPAGETDLDEDADAWNAAMGKRSTTGSN